MTIAKFEFDDAATVVYDDKGNIVAKAETEAFCNVLYGGHPRDVGLLPPAVRWLSPDRRHVLVERPPHERTITIDGVGYEVFLPWTVWFMTFGEEGELISAQVFARNYLIASTEDVLGVLPLPGVHPNGAVDTPSQLAASAKLGLRIDNVIEAFYTQEMSADNFPAASYVPQGWPSDAVGVAKSLEGDHNEVLFAPYQSATVANVGALLVTDDLAADEQTDVLDYLAIIVKKAGADA